MDVPMIPASDIQRADTQTLRRALAQAVTITAQSLQYMGAIWMELEKRGEDLSALRGGLAGYLPLIASGKVKAEAVVKYAGKSMLLKAISNLSIGQQEKLIRDDTVEVAKISPDDGTVNMVPVPLSRITSDQIRTAFSPFGLRPAAEQQRLAMALHAPKKRRPSQSDAVPKIDAATKQLRLGRSYFTASGKRVDAESLLDALSVFYGADLRTAIPKM